MSGQQKKEKNKYKATLNLPKTSFSMKANLVQREPLIQKRWEKMSLYEKTQEARQAAEPFVFHDGPPYANGDIHMGHMLNKSLKDLVVRSQTMFGKYVHFVPGWDCHGLPIEHKVLQEMGKEARTMSPMDVRKRCAKYANKYVKLQREQMKRLGTIADYPNPYVTLDPGYEARVLEVFEKLVEQGIVYRGLKPVHWSIDNETALAEAELEYYDREDTSVYVLFELNNAQKLPQTLNTPGGVNVKLMIWTTTPWTLPANLAVAVAPASLYSLFTYEKAGQTHYVVMADALGDQVLKREADEGTIEKLGDCIGRELEEAELNYKHPFCDDDRVRPVVTAEYVTLEDGTGMVHTAPGHGVEDYQTGLRVGLEIYCPVKGDGTYDDTVPQWLRGENIKVWDANGMVCDRLVESGHMFHQHQFMHSYPHDWRGKSPIIFRATEQWFIGVDMPRKTDGRSLREMALTVTESEVNFIPEWGRNRMRGMLDNRPDWCISRQRAWGLPIPAFVNAEGEALLTPATVKAIVEKVRERGSDCWYYMDTATLLENYDPATDADAPAWAKTLGADDVAALKKGSDIFDVWFDSGASWNGVIVERGIGFPADLYLEGSDQHRGWFQVSLLNGLGARGVAPFKALLTHGFMVDKDGKKMSKSDGNAIKIEELFKEYGADVCRWWVSSLNYANDIKTDMGFFKLAGEEYRKVRNTIRFLLSNLNDFNASQDAVDLTTVSKTSVEDWVLGELSELINVVTESYATYQYRRANEAMFNFCNDTISAVYGNACKDRLYCDKADSPRRRQTQTVMHLIAGSLVKLMAPILVHTAEEAWLAINGMSVEQADQTTSVHLEKFPVLDHVSDPRWARVMSLKDQALKALEGFRADNALDNPLDAGIMFTVPEEELHSLSEFAEELTDLCGVSQCTIEAGEQSIVVRDLVKEGVARCDRSWKRDGTVQERSDGGLLSTRDAEAVGV